MKASLVAAAVSMLCRDLYPGAVVGVIGAPQTGKSRVVKLADEKGAFRRRIVFEPYARRDRTLKGSHPWAGELVTFEELIADPFKLDRAPLSLVVDPFCDPFDADELGRRFGVVAQLCFHTSGVDLIAEEAALYAREAAGAVNVLATGGAHAAMRLVVIAQSFTRFQIDARRNVSHVVAFAQSSEEDTAALRSKSKTFAERVRKLPRGAAPALWRHGDAA